jgi:hypothetical protein
MRKYYNKIHWGSILKIINIAENNCIRLNKNEQQLCLSLPFLSRNDFTKRAKKVIAIAY